MKKNFLITCSLLFNAITFSSAQITFQKTYGGTGDDFGISARQTTDGGYIMTGSTLSYGIAEDVYLIKTDSNGDTLWTKTYGGTNYDFRTSVEQTTDGGYIISATTASFGNSIDIYLIKTDANGDTLWTKTYGGTSADYSYDVQQTSDGGYIITGYAYSFGTGPYRAYLIKTDPAGSVLWTKSYGGSGEFVGHSVQQTNDGGYIVCGIFYPASSNSVYLLKTDANGDTLWTKILGGPGSDQSYSVVQTSDGGYILTGSTLLGSLTLEVYLIKTDGNGTVLWSRTFGTGDNDTGYSIQQTADGGYIIAAYNEDAYLIKTDAGGNLLWSKAYGGGTGSDRGLSVQQTSDGGYIIGGLTESFGAGGYDAYLIKTDSLGNSNCNESNPATAVNTPATQIYFNPSTTTSANATVAGTSPITGRGGTITTLCTSTGIKEIKDDHAILISPNPCKSNFIITMDNITEKGEIEIFNVFGEKIFNQTFYHSSDIAIHLKNPAEGIYFVKVFDGEKYICKKILIEQN